MSGTVTIFGIWANDATTTIDRNDEQAIFKDFSKFTDCITEINNTRVDSSKHLDVVMPMYNLIEYRNNYSKISGNVYHFYRNEPNDNDIARQSS